MLPSSIITLALFFSLSVAAAPPRPRDPLHIPVVRRRSPRRGPQANIDHYAAVSKALKNKYSQSDPSTPSRRGSTTDISIIDQSTDTNYAAQVSVGTPPQSFLLDLDTGSSDLWFAGNTCEGCGSGTPELNPSSSSSLQLTKNRVTMNYGSGSASGVFATDTVTMGPYTVNQQGFVVVDTASQGLTNSQLSGIMGLAFQGIADSGAVPFWEALTNSNQLSNPEFSFFITRFDDDPSAQSEEPGGVLTFGGTNSTLYQGSIDFQSFTPPGTAGSFWLQNVAGVTVNGKSVIIGSGNSAAIDTGTTLIGGPTEAVTAIWASISSGVQPLTGSMTGYYAFPCSSPPQISISFGGPAWPISTKDINLGPIGKGLCLGAIFDLTAGTNVKPQSGQPAWIIGDTFLKNVYSVFRSNPAAVGFAQLSSAAGGSSGTPGPAVSGSKPAPSSGGGANFARPMAPLGAASVILTGVIALLATAFMLTV